MEVFVGVGGGFTTRHGEVGNARIDGLDGLLAVVVTGFLVVVVLIVDGGVHTLTPWRVHGIKFLIGKGHRVGIDCRRRGELRIKCHL